MRIKIPSIENQEKYIEGKSSIVLIGANGSGKTRMSIWIDENNPKIEIHRIAAQKSLNFPKVVSPTTMQQAEEKLFYGEENEDKGWLRNTGKKTYRWGNAPETHFLDDYKALMQLLMTENYEKSIEYRDNHKNGNMTFDNTTRLEKIKRIWENVLSHRKMKIDAGKIEISNPNIQCNKEQNYNASEMSDGERSIFYFIGEVLCAKKNSLIIIDEPENHLHKSILSKLWDTIEEERTDCTFLYITHDLNFANSRVNSQIIWVKEFLSTGEWKYKILDDIDSTDSLKLEIMGNRQNVLLVEGKTNKSIDSKLYSRVYRDYNVIPMESCNSVIQTVKAYQQTPNLHYVDVKGIIDRDRRNDNEILQLKKSNIFVTKVAEVENLFLLDDVIQTVAEKQDKNEMMMDIIDKVHRKTFEFLEVHINEQALLFTKQEYNNYIIQKINKNSKTIEEYETNLSESTSSSELQSIYKEKIEKINKIITDKNYIEALKIINDKGLLPYTKVASHFGWKKDYYVNYVLTLLGKDGTVENHLKDVLRKSISDLDLS